jgi:hypothetical protein
MFDDRDDCTCWSCDGTGIGDPHAETNCPECGGTGELKRDDFDDFDPPDDYDVDWDTPQDCMTDSRGRAW